VTLFVFLPYCYPGEDWVAKKIRLIFKELMEAPEKNYNATLSADLVRELKILAATQDRKVNDLMAEAFEDLLKKYENAKERYRKAVTNALTEMPYLWENGEIRKPAG
jgi:uncharacterized protein with gpF-like domain